MANPKPKFMEPTESNRTFDLIMGRSNVTGPKQHTSYIETLAHLLKCYVGTGIFAMGDAFKNSGILFGGLGLVVIASLNLYCQHQLVNAAKRVASQESEDVRPNFAETVEYTVASGPERFRKYDKCFATVSNVFIVITEVGFCCVYFVFVAEHIQQVLGANGLSLNIYAILAIIFIPMWATTYLGSLKLLIPLSMTANALMTIGIIMIFYKTSIGLEHISERALVADFRTFPLYFGTALFAFEGITVVLPLRNEMRNPSVFDKPLGVLNVGICIVSCLYVTVGFMAYWKYGDKVRGSVFLNFGEHDVLSQIIKVIMSVAVMFTFTVHMYIPFEITFPLFYNRYGPFKHPFWVKFWYRTVPVVLAYLFANIIPKLGLFISLQGSLMIPFLALIVPAILDLMCNELNWWVVFRNVTIIFLGVICSLTGTYVCLYTAYIELVKSHFKD